ncbi:MAG TPA: class I SAM-dependent methyltransferase [Chthoniobacterales bacterium]|nr:class I SAM-dependent methyltransferase [Chthoniobacterales bacterium]
MIEGQLNEAERQVLTGAVLHATRNPRVVLEVGTWLGGGSTIHLLTALEQNGEGHLWGIEADKSIYDRMLENIRQGAPNALHRFTPLFGFSQDVIPEWLRQQGPRAIVDVAFLDGGNNPGEQITEFYLLEPFIPVGGRIFAHDARMRKGKWLVPYVCSLDNWRVRLHDVSEFGLMEAEKISPQPSTQSRRSARLRLLAMRCNPVEIAAAILPSSVCGFILRLLPRRLSVRLSDGR